MDTAKGFMELLYSFWQWLVVGFGVVILRLVYGKIVNDPFNRLKKLEERMEMFEKNYPDKKYVDSVAERIMHFHEEMDVRELGQHKQQREDFKHLEDRIDDMIDKIFDLLRNK